MTDIRVTIVHFMEYLGLSLGKAPLEPGWEYWFKSFGFKEERFQALHRGFTLFWARAGFTLQGEAKDDQTLVFSLRSTTEPLGVAIKFRFIEASNDLGVTFYFSDADSALTEKDRQLLKEIGVKM